MSRWFVRICAALIVIRAFTNFAKLFQGDRATLVLFGQILHGGEAALPSVIVGLLMLVTGIALWTERRWALPLIALYATYVLVNLLAWTIANPGELEHVGARFSSATEADALRWRGALLFLGYCVVALVTTAGPAWVLWRNAHPRES
jgi:hypothetical protein